MSKLITTSRLARFWTNVKSYVDTALNGKAATNHTHSEYANATHTHSEYAASSHSHSYNDLTNKPTIPTTVAQLTDASSYALKSELTSVYKYKGSVATSSALPTTATTGDVYNVESDGMNYAWNGTAWDALGSSVTLELATDAEIDALFA
jgi:hypothetical protein